MARTIRPWRRRNRRTEGAAYAEAVIMLPVFFIIFTGFYVLYNANTARLDAMSVARTEAWRIASEGCPLGESSECVGDACGAIGTVTSGLDAALAGTGPARALLQSVLDSLLGPNTMASDTQTFAGSGAFSGGSAGAAYQVVCNTQRETFMGLIKRAACAMVPTAVASYLSSFCGG